METTVDPLVAGMQFEAPSSTIRRLAWCITWPPYFKVQTLLPLETSGERNSASETITSRHLFEGLDCRPLQNVRVEKWNDTITARARRQERSSSQTTKRPCPVRDTSHVVRTTTTTTTLPPEHLLVHTPEKTSKTVSMEDHLDCRRLLDCCWYHRGDGLCGGSRVETSREKLIEARCFL